MAPGPPDLEFRELHLGEETVASFLPSTIAGPAQLGTQPSKHMCSSLPLGRSAHHP